MATRAIQKFSSMDEVVNFTQAAGIGEVGGSLMARTTDGAILSLGSRLSKGKLIFLAPDFGSDDNDGLSPEKAKATLDGASGAFSVATDGQNDTIVLIGDGTTGATERLDAAFTWNKDATHLLGVCSRAEVSQRARIAPTGTTTAFANFFTVSASGCQFENVQFFHGFNTGVANSICMTITGSRNVFVNCHLAGMGDAVSAGDAGSRCLKISGGGENRFIGGAIGLDTVDRTVANAAVEFASGTARNTFEGVQFNERTTTLQTQVFVRVAAAAGADRYQKFDRCIFWNAGAFTGGTTPTAVCNLAASIGGALIFEYCGIYGITGWGADATSRGQIRVNGADTTAGTAGIAVAPTA